MKKSVFLFFSSCCFSQVMVSLCLTPPGTNGRVQITACAPTGVPTPAQLTGVPLNTLAAGTLAIPLNDGTYVPIVVVNVAPAAPIPAQAGLINAQDPENYVASANIKIPNPTYISPVCSGACSGYQSIINPSWPNILSPVTWIPQSAPAGGTASVPEENEYFF
jgi:hypothetical protein